MMKINFQKTALAVGITAALMGGASAASAKDWTGAYVGGSLGLGSYSAQFSDYDDEFDNQGLSGKKNLDANEGLHVGMNFQDNSVVYGVELGYTTYGAKSTSDQPDGTGTMLKAELKDAISLKARVGLVSGDNLLYVAAGPTWANSKLTVNDYGDLSSKSTRTLGLAMAAGVEHKFNPNLSTRLQAEYTSFSTSSNFTDVDGYNFAHNDTLLNVSLGVSYAF